MIKTVEINDNIYQIGESYIDVTGQMGVLVTTSLGAFVLKDIEERWIVDEINIIPLGEYGSIIPATKINKLAIELIQYQEAMDHQDPDQTHNEMQLIEFLNDECDSEEQYQNAIVTAMRTLGVSK